MQKNDTCEELKDRIRQLEQAVSVRQANEQALRYRLEQYRSILNDIPLLVCNYLPGGQILFVNKAYCVYFNRPPEELVGSIFLSLIPEADRKSVMNNISALTMESPTQSHEHQVVAKDGSIRWQRWTNKALFDDQGQVTAYQAVGEDITERRRVENELRQSEELHRITLSSISDAVFLTDDAGQFVYICPNVNHIFGYSHSEVRTLGNIQKLLGAGLFNGNELKAARELKNIECEIKDRSGQTHNLLVNVKRVRIKGGTTLYACRDITDRKRAESLVKQLSRKTIAAIESQRKALSREIHDSIGGTLAAIKYQLESRVEQMGAPPESVSMPLENIVSHLDGVIHESRRITKQLRPSVLDDFGLRSAMDEHIRDFQSFHPKITVLRRFDIHEDQLTSDAKIVLYRVLQETLNNVGKHSKADQVHIQCYHGQGSVILQVEDNGVGFDLEEVFGSANVLGGYGLYGMTERVEICSGQLHVASKPGQGTTVHARIPLEAG